MTQLPNFNGIHALVGILYLMTLTCGKSTRIVIPCLSSIPTYARLHCIIYSHSHALNYTRRERKESFEHAVDKSPLPQPRVLRKTLFPIVSISDFSTDRYSRRRFLWRPKIGIKSFCRFLILVFYFLDFLFGCLRFLGFTGWWFCELVMCMLNLCIWLVKFGVFFFWIFTALVFEVLLEMLCFSSS